MIKINKEIFNCIFPSLSISCIFLPFLTVSLKCDLIEEFPFVHWHNDIHVPIITDAALLLHAHIKNFFFLYLWAVNWWWFHLRIFIATSISKIYVLINFCFVSCCYLNCWISLAVCVNAFLVIKSCTLPWCRTFFISFFLKYFS